jgi:hypothetical protein
LLCSTKTVVEWFTADALEAADALLGGGCSPAKTAAHIATLHSHVLRGDAATQAAVRGALAADLAPLTVLLSGLICGKKVGAAAPRPCFL